MKKIPPLSPEDITEAVRRRFWKRVRTKVPGTSCWKWTGTRCKKAPYGLIKVSGRRVPVHRVSYVIHKGPIPPDTMILHSCDNPSCPNPDHLTPGTHQDNMDDMVTKGRQASGDKSSSRLYPERRPRGASHWSHVHADLMPRGEQNGRAKINKMQADEIRRRAATESHRRLAAEFGIGKTQVGRIARGEEWA